MKDLICEKCEQRTPAAQANECSQGTWHCPFCNHLNLRGTRQQTLDWETASVVPEVNNQENENNFSMDDQELQSSIPPLAQGDRIEHFVIQRLVGAGGFGYVFLAFDEKLERSVALKIPHAKRISENRKADFLREAKIAAKLTSPHVVSVFEVGETNGRIWISNEYVDGQSLKAYLSRNQSLSENEAIEICQSICKGVVAAHELRIIHRDLKPGNILISRSGNVVVTDFGLAFRDEPTREGKIYGIVGTLPYMSPEQLEFAESVDRRTDVYAIGIILYEMLTGKRPYRGPREDLIPQILDAEPVPPHTLNRKVSPELEAVCLKAMAGNSSDRYQSVSDLLDDINRVAEGQTPSAFHPSISNRIKRTVKRFKWHLVSAVAMVLIAIAIAPFFARDTPQPGTYPVVITTDPVGARIAVLPIDPQTYQPDRSKMIQPDEAMQYTLDLEPGTYLVEAVSTISGNLVIQEVVRTVPEKLMDSPNYIHRSREFTVNKKRRSVVWPVISLSFQTPIENLKEVDGGTFLTGSDLNNFFPLEEATVDSFELMKSEVNVEQYQIVMVNLPYQMTQRNSGNAIDPELSVTNVSFFDALEFAERAHLRLPTLDELLFVATNKGTTNFPWGDQPKTVQPNDLPQSDITIDPEDFRGLATDVGELTQTGPGNKLPPQLTQTPCRQALGYPLPKAENNLPRKSARFFSTVSLTDTSDGLGFRCARSLKPRFVTTD